MCLGAADPRKREQVVDQAAHPICRFQDHRQVSLTLFIERCSRALAQKLGKTCHVAKWGTQVVRYGIGKGFQLLVAGFERSGTFCKLLVERLHLFLPALSCGDVVAGFKDRDRAVLLITPQGPPARHDHLDAVRLGVREFALPSIRLQQLFPNFLERLWENGAQEIRGSLANRFLLCPSVEFFRAPIPVGDDRIHVPDEDGIVR